MIILFESKTSDTRYTKALTKRFDKNGIDYIIYKVNRDTEKLPFKLTEEVFDSIVNHTFTETVKYKYICIEPFNKPKLEKYFKHLWSNFENLDDNRVCDIAINELKGNIKHVHVVGRGMVGKELAKRLIDKGYTVSTYSSDREFDDSLMYKDEAVIFTVGNLNYDYCRPLHQVIEVGFNDVQKYNIKSLECYTSAAQISDKLINSIVQECK